MSSINSSTHHQQQRHVAVLAFPYGTHAAPILSLARRLAAEAPEVLFSFFNTSESNKSLFPGPDTDNIKAYEVPDGLPAGYVFGENPEEPVNMFLEVAEEGFRGGMAAAEAERGRKISCLLTDAFFWFAAEMAEEMNVPWVVYRGGGPRSSLVHIDADIIRNKMGPHVQEDTILNFIPGFSEIPAGDILEMVSVNPKSPFSKTLHEMGHALPRATAVATNSFEEIDPNITAILRSKLKELLNVGPFILTSPPPYQADPHGCLEWLDRQKPASVVYIAFGRMAAPPPSELAAIAEALQETESPFIWSMRPNVEAQLPKAFLDGGHKGKIVPWAPQQQVLAHSCVGVCVTHGGWNSVLESIVGGVPILCRPFFGDQKLNMRVVQDVWGMGLGVESGRFTKNETIKAFGRILSSEEGVEMREKIKVRRELAFKAVEPNGSSTRNFERLVHIVTK